MSFKFLFVSYDGLIGDIAWQVTKEGHAARYYIEHEEEREITAGRYRGPLHGIPFGLKDIYATAGIRTTSHSKICENLVPTEDATTVSKLYQAGGVLLGKLATHEFAHGGPSFDLPWPPARNPWNRDHFTGGSSSGAGAAVAAGFVPGALGSDTGGSIRGPAALCGIVSPLLAARSCRERYLAIARYAIGAQFPVDKASGAPVRPDLKPLEALLGNH